MKVLIIPDTHLKPWIFERADELMKKHNIKQAIQLGDNLDDFYATPEDYKNHNAMMVWFNHIHPETIWLYGNHEVSYILNRPVTGNVEDGKKWASAYQIIFQPKTAWKIDNVIFSHAGITDEFIYNNPELKKFATDPDKLIGRINALSLWEVWNENGPLWSRHQLDGSLLYEFRQVCGHTPLETVRDVDNCISTDVFSTEWGKKYGEEKFIIINTETGEWEYA